MPAPPFFHSPGDIASCVTNRSCSRPGPESPESSAASSTLAESRNRPLAWSSVSARHRLDGRLRAPVLGDEGDGAPHRIIVAKRGVLGAGLAEMVVMDCEVHH